MKIAKVRNVKTPARANKDDAGIDFFVPEFDEKFIKDLREKNLYLSIILDENEQPSYINLHPHNRILIPSGIHVNFIEDAEKNSTGLALVAHNKSGVASKKGLDRLAEVVDESYQGEVHLSLVNTGYETIKIYPGDKIVQFILVPVYYSDIQETNITNLYDKESNRGTGGFGSTN
jgi:dUTP pyrophosphatase